MQELFCGTGLRCPAEAYRLLPLPARTKWLGSVAEDTTHFGYRTHRNGDGTELKNSIPSLLVSIHSASRCYVGCWERKFINSLTSYGPCVATILTQQVRYAPWYNSSRTILELADYFVIGF